MWRNFPLISIANIGREIIPGIIAQYEERTAKLKADVPQLEAIISKSWGKEDELKQLKSDLAALDRKITAALAPKREEQDGEEVICTDASGRSAKIEESDTAQKEPTNNSTMVAEPQILYKTKNDPHCIPNHFHR